jgi:hypothetical protein
MKKIVFAVIIAAVAASPAMAAKKAKKAAAPPAPTADANENGRRFVKDAFPIFLPSWLMPVYVANDKK